MAERKITDRIVWAVQMLDVQPSEQVLEIGCGHGLAVSLVCNKLRRGRLTAIDRSSAMIEVARKRNAAHLAAGKVEFHTMCLAAADFEHRRFSRIFAIDVNLFWINPTDELPVVKRLLRPDGKLYLFHQPPSSAQLGLLERKLSRNLEDGGFALDRIVASKSSVAGRLCIVAGVAKDAA